MAAFPDDPASEDPVAERAIERAAALDDYFGGLAAADGHHAGLDPDDTTAPGIAGLVDTMLLLRQTAAADGVVPAATPVKTPRAIGRHAILRLAGEGGCATVWEAFDTVLRRPVAIKMPRPEALLSETARRRFTREAEIAARLVHPHIVTIFEVGEDGGREFIAAELCPGGSLAAWLDRHPGPLAPFVAARLVRALAGAMAYAHDAGVLHRDIKPANILLLPAPAGTEPILRESIASDANDPGLTVKLGDFGLGTFHGAGDMADPLTQLTRSGASIGTPAWMAPEQIDRSFGPVGPATDVHALGLLLDRLLTGRALRSGSTTAETYRQVLFDEAVLADRAVRGVPRDLAAVCLKCLAKHPAARYSSAAALADDLDRCLAGRPTVARPLSATGRAARSIRQRPVVAVVGTVAVIASLVAVWAGAQRARERHAAALQQDELRRQSSAAELRRGFEALHAGSVAQALEKLSASRAADPALADSIAGRWLLRRAHGERAILLEPDGSAMDSSKPRDLYAITLSPDGASAAVAGADGIVRLIRGLDAVPSVCTVMAHDEVNDVAFSPDGALLATVGQDGWLRWWDVTDAGLVAAGAADIGTGALYAAAFTLDGRAIAVGGEDRWVRIVPLDAADLPVELFRFEPPPGRTPDVESIVFVGPDTLAACCGDAIVLLDAVAGRTIREFVRPAERGPNAVLGSLTVSRDGGRLMACGTDARAHVWDVATGRLVTALPAHPAWVQGCAFLPDGTRVATACRDGGLRVYDLNSGALLARALGHVGRVWCVVAEPAGTLLTCGADGTVRRWGPQADFATAALRPLPVAGAEVCRIAVGSADDGGKGRPLIACDNAGDLWSIDVVHGPSRRLDRPWGSPAIEIGLDGSGRRLAVSWKHDHPIDVIDVVAQPPRTMAHVLLADSFDSRSAIPCWTSTGDLVVCSRHGNLRVAAGDLSRIATVESPLEDPVQAIAAAPDGTARFAAAGKHSAILQSPDASGSARAIPPLEFPVGEETCAVAWTPDASLVGFGTRTGRVLLFDAATGKAQGTLVPHERNVMTVAFSRDGRCVVTADEACVRVSDVTTRTTLDEIRPGWHIKTARLSADDGCIVVGGRAADQDGAGGGRLAVLELDGP